jgi:undecaprenyl-diphosphatase
MFVIAMGYLLYRHLRAEALFLATAILGSIALNGILKVFIQRPRPQLPWAHVPLDYSFPSGHSMNSLVFYLAIALIIWTRAKAPAGSIAVIAALLIAISVGLSRIYLGYHYLSDVIGGFAAGLAWLLVVALAFETIPRAWVRRPWARRPTRRSA